MDLERHPRPAPRERTFAQVFPWRSLRRALMLVVLIVAIVILKQRMGTFLEHAGRLWVPPSTPAASSVRVPSPARAPGEGGPAAGTTTVHLGPSLAPARTTPADRP